MSETVTKRLYIGGLSSGVTEDEISERFSRFGKVSDLSLKSRHDDEGICIKVFAHLNIEGNEENIKKCFNTYQNTRWKGSVLKLQYAKESFLTRLEKERESEVKDNIKEDSNEEPKTSGGEWKPPQFTKLNGPAVPGTPIAGKKDWIVGKYGRVLPILNVKKSYKLKPVKHDPSKFCHAARVFKDENKDDASTSVTCDSLTWEITKPDSEITKKRKGEFPPSSPSKKSKKSPVIDPKDYFTSDIFTSSSQGKESPFDDFEIVKIGQKKSAESVLVRSRFDSDYEDDDLDNAKINMPVNSFNGSKSPEKVVQSSCKRIQGSEVKNELLLNPKLSELTENDKKNNFPKTKADISKDTKLVNASTNQKIIATPKSDFSGNKRRKVPEFAGLGMLINTASSSTSQRQEDEADDIITSHDNMTEERLDLQTLVEKEKSTSKSFKPSEKKTGLAKPSKENKKKHAADNEKRLQALDEQKKMKEQQKQIVKAALENVDTACTKRIVFSSSDEEDAAEGNKESVKPTQEISIEGVKIQDDSKKPSTKLTLLDNSSSDESDYEEMFKSKPQFEGKKGEKLMEMQRKIGDSRFQMDEKFMDSGDSDDEEEKAEEVTEEQNLLKDEKKMNLEVLENVVGKSKLDHFTAKMKKKTKYIIDMNAVRFDPTKVKLQNPEPEQKEETSDVDEEEEMEVEPSSAQPVAKPTKSEEKTKEGKRKEKEKEQSRSNVTMSSSLVNMLKNQAKEKDYEATDDTSFSLLQQFDENNENRESSDEDDNADKAVAPLSHLLSPKEVENSMKAQEEETKSSSNEESDDSDVEDNEQSSDENSGEEDNEQTSDEDSEEEDNEESSDEDSDEEENEQSSEKENVEHSPDKEDDTDKSGTDSEISKEISKEKIPQPNKVIPFNVEDLDRQEDDDEENMDEKDELKSITTTYNPLEEKERALTSAGRTDIRFTKKEWLERWDEIRTDLMKLCRRKHKDAGKRKRVLNEKKRKKEILKNIKRKPWLKH